MSTNELAIAGAGSDAASAHDAAFARARLAARLGWSAFALTTLGSLSGWLLLTLSGSQADRVHGGAGLQHIDFPVFALVGALIVSRRWDNTVGWLCCTVGVISSFALNGLGFGYVHYALFGPVQYLPGAVWVAWLTDWINDLGFGLGPVILLLFPTGHPASRAWRPVVWCALSLAVLSAVADALRPGPRVNFPYVDNPTGLPIPVLTPISQALGVAIALLFLVGASSVFVRLRNARGVERLQVKWFAYATLLIALGILLVIAGPELLGVDLSQSPEWVGAALNGFWSIAILALPVSIGIAILRHRLYDIDLLINRTLVYGALVAAIVGVYVLVVGYIGLLFQTRGDVVSLFAAGIAAVLFQPLRQRLQAAVNRLLYGSRDEPYAVLSLLGRRLETIIEPDAVMPAIVETVRQALRVPYVALELGSSEGQQIAAESGKASPIALRVAVPYQSERIGSLLVAARSRGEALSAADHQLLEDVARQAGPAIHAVAVTSELRVARERLVATREEERRRLRRDLHDGFGPRLASLGLQLAALRNALAADPALQTRVESLKSQTQEAVDDVRRLVEGLRPPALDELGLIGAVEQYASRFAGLQVCLDTPRGLPPLPAAVEVAAYRIITEALTNVARHACAASCRVQVVLDGDTLQVEVVDDGRGVDSTLHAGTGLLSMRERAEELGGTYQIESAPSGGARVLARLPIAMQRK